MCYNIPVKNQHSNCYPRETGFYYLQSRYYDPGTGRFINADSLASTGQGFLGYNMFAYCNNNPIIHGDETGYAFHHTTMVMKDGSSGYRKKDSNTRRDVTDEVTKALTNTARYARTKRLACEQSMLDTTFVLKDVYAEFYSMVNHEADWDIKRQASWEKTIGTEYPGYNVEVTFCGGVVTPEHLGNFTYGYLGQAYDIPLMVLLGGSYYAAGFPTETDDLLNEIKDWCHIAIGYAFAEKGYLEGGIY